MNSSVEPGFRFEPESHTYWLGSERLPSWSAVSRTAGLCEDFSRIPAHVLDRKRAIGEATHYACELLIAGELDRATVAPEVEPYFLAFEKYLLDEAPEISIVETPMYHRELLYGCRPDLVLTDGSCVEIKTTLKLSQYVWLQLSAQGMCLDSMMTRKQRNHYALQLCKDGTYKLERRPQRPEDESAVASAVSIWRWKERKPEPVRATS